MFFVCFFSQFVLGQLRMLHKIKSGLQLLEILRTILQYCHSLPIPPRIWGRREEIWEMSLVSSNFEELSNPSGSHTSHSMKSWSYQYSTPVGGQPFSNSTNSVTRFCQAISVATPCKYLIIGTSHAGKFSSFWGF